MQREIITVSEKHSLRTESVRCFPQFAEVSCQNTVWLGHAGLKKAKAGVGYALVSGLVLGAAGIFGLFTFLSNMVPPAVCAVTFLWCAIVMVAQAFKDCDKKHYAAVGIAMVPPVADYLYTQITGSVGLAGYMTEVMPSGLAEYNAEVTQMIKDAGVMWNGVPAVKSGAIIIGILLGTMTVFIIDKQLHKVAITAVVGYVLACFGFYSQCRTWIQSCFTVCNWISDRGGTGYHPSSGTEILV